MSQIRTTFLALCLLLLVFALSGCGDKNSQGDVNPVTGAHSYIWLTSAGHPVVAKAQINSCAECHGGDFKGGISKVACTQCHLGNQFEVHPLLWGQYAYALHGGYVKQNGTAGCSNLNCHGTDLAGVAGSGPSCSSCHMGGPTSSHPLAWNADITLHASYVGQNGTSSCRSIVCHGSNLQGVFLSGPSCNACHNF